MHPSGFPGLSYHLRRHLNELCQPSEYLNLYTTPQNPCHSSAPEMVLAPLDFQILLFCTVNPSYIVHLLYLERSLLGPRSLDILVYVEE